MPNYEETTLSTGKTVSDQAKENMTSNVIRGKILITGELLVKTGMHIGGGTEYAPIGSVDSPFIRDPLTQKPIIPGSSLKGKIRTLLARYCYDKVTLNSIDIDNDNEIIKRLFGSTNNQVPARLQFRDLFVTDESERIFDTIDTDTYMGEIKFENTINRVTSVANPRQIERVPAGTKFDFELVYTIVDETQMQEDLKMLTDGFNLLKLDYLGGHGTRGYGRVEIDITEVIRYPQSDDNVSNEYLRILQNKELTECEKDKENA